MRRYPEGFEKRIGGALLRTSMVEPPANTGTDFFGDSPTGSRCFMASLMEPRDLCHCIHGGSDGYSLIVIAALRKVCDWPPATFSVTNSPAKNREMPSRSPIFSVGE